MPILQRDAEAKRAMKQTMSFERLIETATNGLEYVPEPGHRRVLLIPMFVAAARQPQAAWPQQQKKLVKRVWLQKHEAHPSAEALPGK